MGWNWYHRGLHWICPQKYLHPILWHPQWEAFFLLNSSSDLERSWVPPWWGPGCDPHDFISSSWTGEGGKPGGWSPAPSKEPDDIALGCVNAGSLPGGREGGMFTCCSSIMRRASSVVITPLSISETIRDWASSEFVPETVNTLPWVCALAALLSDMAINYKLYGW